MIFGYLVFGKSIPSAQNQESGFYYSVMIATIPPNTTPIITAITKTAKADKRLKNTGIITIKKQAKYSKYHVIMKNTADSPNLIRKDFLLSTKNIER